MWVVSNPDSLRPRRLHIRKTLSASTFHGMLFKKPVRNGQIIRLESKVVMASKTRLVSYVKLMDNVTGGACMDGFLSFVHVDKQGKASPHGIVLDYADPEDAALLERARTLR